VVPKSKEKPPPPPPGSEGRNWFRCNRNLSLEHCFKSVRDSKIVGVSEGLDASIHHATIWNAASGRFRRGRVANNFQKRHKSSCFITN
jgi:hypothetical protein